MQTAQEMDGIREIAASMRAGRFEKGVQVRMARAPVACDARKLGFGNADRLTADGPIDRHSFPLV
jgi:hypothetical protein